MEISIDANLVATLERLATERQINTIEYVDRYVRAHLLSQLRKNLTEKVITKDLLDLMLMEEAIVAVDKEILARNVEPGPPEIP